MKRGSDWERDWNEARKREGVEQGCVPGGRAIIRGNVPIVTLPALPPHTNLVLHDFEKVGDALFDVIQSQLEPVVGFADQVVEGTRFTMSRFWGFIMSRLQGFREQGLQ